MRFGLLVQMTGVLGYPQPLARLARAAEAAGWDGFFIWDVFGGDSTAPSPVVDPWIALAAIAATTERIRFGPMVTPLPRRRPWKLACEAASLDHRSGGRLILGVGIGTPQEEFARFGEEVDPKRRAEMLDEGLEVLTGLRTPSFRRAARWDGVVPGSLHGNLTLDEIRAMVSFIHSQRPSGVPIDVMVGGNAPFDTPERARAILAEYAAAGVTWWMEGIGEWRGDVDA